MEARGIAIFGYYRSAVEVAAYLRTGKHRIVIIDDKGSNLEKARRAGFETAELDYRDDAELETLGLGKEIDTVFSLFPNDAENVYLTISTRALAPDVRIFTIAHGREAVPILRAAGANKVIETREIMGSRIWDILTRPVVTAMLDHTLFGQANLNIAEVPVPAGSFAEGKTLAEAGLGEIHDLVLLGIVDQELQEHFVYGTEGQTMRLRAGHILVFIGPADAIERLKQDLCAGGEWGVTAR